MSCELSNCARLWFRRHTTDFMEFEGHFADGMETLECKKHSQLGNINKSLPNASKNTRKRFPLTKKTPPSAQFIRNMTANNYYFIVFDDKCKF